MHRRGAIIVCGLAASALLAALTLAPSAAGARPRNGAIVSSPPLLNWRSVPGALAYNVQLWRNGRKILSRFPVASRLQLSRRWHYRTRVFRLSAGVYRWYVWPWLGRRYGRLRVNRSFIVAWVPRNVLQPAVSGEAREGMLLTATRGRWRGTRPITHTYSWERCDAAGCAAIPGAGEATFAVGADDIDRTIRVVVTATNLAGARSARSIPTAVVLPAPPTNMARPSILGSPQQGRLLTALLGAWHSSRPLRFELAWLRCDAAGRACVPIAGAAGPTYTLGRADFERRVRISVLAANDGGAASAVSLRTPRIGRIYRGGRGNDVLRGSRGADVLRGRGGHDALFGGWGADRIVGGGGNDRLVGGPHADVLLARDRLWDAIDCGRGFDRVFADRVDQVSHNCERVRRR